MSRVLSNYTSFAVAFEASLGTLPGSPSWHLMEPNTVPKGGPEVSKVTREPLSKRRQNQKGGVTDLDSSWQAELDATREHLLYLLPPAMYTVWTGPRTYVPTAVTSTGYTVAANGDLPAGTLIVASGLATAANNSPTTFKVVGAASTGTEIKTSGLTAEAAIPAAQNALVEVAGVRGAVGDITIASGNLVSTILDWTTLRLHVGMFIWIGGATANTFVTAADRGLARITSISATTLGLDKKSSTFVNDNGATKLIDIYFGRWARNVDVDDSEFSEQTLQVETRFHDLNGVGTPEYTYAKGNLVDEMALGFSGQDKATMSLTLTGTDTPIPAITRATGGATPILPVQVKMFNTSSDLTRLRVTEADETGVTSDLTEMTLTLGNNVDPEKVLGTLGARFMNSGNFDVTAETTCVLTSSEVIAAVRDNRDMTMEIGFRNADGGFVFDLPLITLGDGTPDFTPDQSVRVKLKLEAVESPSLGYTMSVSCFPYLPEA